MMSEKYENRALNGPENFEFILNGPSYRPVIQNTLIHDGKKSISVKPGDRLSLTAVVFMNNSAFSRYLNPKRPNLSTADVVPS